MIRRKDSLAFAEFVRAKFNVNDTKKIKRILTHLTIDEYSFLYNAKTAEEIWNKLWTPKKSRLNEYNKVKKKLEFLIQNSLKSILDEITPTRIYPEWGFPKGRRIPRESDIHCSIREFCEETDMKKEDFKILTDIKPLQEVFTGTNGIIYKHIYYVAELVNDIKLHINPDNTHQKAEIGDIQWFTEEEALQKIEEENTERIKLFKDLCTLLFYKKVDTYKK
jgi:hypothetical protein